MKQSILFFLLLPLLFASDLFAQADYEIQDESFRIMDAFFRKYVDNGLVKYDALNANPEELLEILKLVDNATFKADADDLDKKAFYINAYNLTVIKTLVLNYPAGSPQEIPGFFDSEKHKIANEYMTLNELENDLIRPTYKDPRVHFVLVCGAKGCPPITNFAYQPFRLHQQMEMQTKKALNDPNFIRSKAGSKEVGLSKIFEWYPEDFGGGKKKILAYINKYRTTALPIDGKVSYYAYDWNVNATTPTVGGKVLAKPNTSSNTAPSSGNGNQLYLVSSLLDKGDFEIKIFNNLYFQGGRNAEKEVTDRYTFFTITPQVLFGINKRLNVGFDMRFRSVLQDVLEGSSPFRALKFQKTQIFQGPTDGYAGYSRRGMSAFGPKVKYLPFKNVKNVSFQHTFFIPTGSDLTGGADPADEKQFFDFDGFGLLNQIFYDQSLGNGFSLFASSEVFLENLFDKNSSPYVHVPVKAIVSYFRGRVTTYGIVDVTARWTDPFNSDITQRSFNPYAQVGAGVKYQISKRFEVETLLTKFFSTGLNANYGKAATINFGLRYTRQ